MKRIMLFLIAFLQSIAFTQPQQSLSTGKVLQSVAVFIEPSVDTSRVPSLRAAIAQRRGTSQAAEAQFGIGRVFYDGQAYGKALQEMQSLSLDSLSSASASDALYYLANCYSMVRQDEQALAAAKRILKQSPESKWKDAAVLIVGKSLYNLQRYNDALQELNAFVPQTTTSVEAGEALVVKARAYRAANRMEEAMSFYSKFLDDFQRSDLQGQISFERGSVSANLSQYDRAINDFTKALALFQDPEQKAQVQYALASVYLQQRNYETARGEFQKVVDLYRTASVTSLAAFRISTCLIQQQKYSAALAQLLKFQQDYPDFPNKDWPLFFTGTCYWELGRTNEAKTVFQQLLDRFPDSGFKKAAQEKLKG